jgi:hypothetical protein
VSACRSCGAEIVWAEWDQSGKRAPFDREPVVGGNVLLLPGNPPRARLVGVGHEVPLWKSHFATCSAAEQPKGRVA